MIHRQSVAVLRRELITIGIALAVAAAAGSFLILLTGQSPLGVFALLIEQTWGNAYGFGQVLFKATPLILTGLAVALAFHAGMFNIGAEGQMIAGSFTTALCGAALPESTPGIVAVPLCVLAGMAGGGLIGAIPGVLKAYYGAHEVINTIMLNFITGALVLWLGNAFFFTSETTATAPIVAGAQLDSLSWFKPSRANASLWLAIALAIA
ncbi:MAG: ABC transporter permease, partial [Myxococcota bacterium]